MKATYIVIRTLIITLISFGAFAEYNGHQLRFKLTMRSGKEFIGYQYLPQVYREDESISYSKFLEDDPGRVLRNDFSDGMGEYAFFEHRIAYAYLGYGEDSSEIMVLVNKRSIDIDSVKSLNILSMDPQTYMIGISSVHDWSDRHWMNTPAKEKITAGGYLCGHQVFIHEIHSRIAEIKYALDSLKLDFERQMDKQEEIMRFSDGDAYYAAQERMTELEYSLDEKVTRILNRFEGIRVVIISECSC